MLVFLVTGPYSLFLGLSDRLSPAHLIPSFHILLLLFFLQVSLFVHVLFKKNLLFDISFVSGVSEIRWLVKMAFLTARFPMISFSHGRPRPREKKECDEVPKNPAFLSSHLSEDRKTQM